MKTSNGDSIPFDDDEKNVLVVSCSEIEKYVRYFISCGIPQNTSIPCYFVKIFKPFFIPLNVFVQRKRNESPSNGNQRLHKWHLVSQGALKVKRSVVLRIQHMVQCKTIPWLFQTLCGGPVMSGAWPRYVSLSMYGNAGKS